MFIHSTICDTTLNNSLSKRVSIIPKTGSKTSTQPLFMKEELMLKHTKVMISIGNNTLQTIGDERYYTRTNTKRTCIIMINHSKT